jgi:hypothetical protein
MPNVEQEGTTGPRDYLERADGAFAPVPIGNGYDPNRKVGPVVLQTVCSRLGIPMPPGWPAPEIPKSDDRPG